MTTIALEEKYNAAIAGLLNICKKSSVAIDIVKVEDAGNKAFQILGNSCWETGEPIIFHSIKVAKVVANDIGIGTDSIVAALLHNVFESSNEKDEIINQLPTTFGNQVFDLLEGLFKINSIDTVNISVHSENFRRLLLTLSGDLRVVLIKIADRLIDMRNLEGLPSDLQNKYATETSYLYAPLAHRLGIYNIKSELEDLSLKYLRPDDYQLIVKKLEETTEERKKFVSEFVKPIEKKLKSKDFSFEMKARTKSVYSIWNKMKKTKVSFEEVYDLFAIRVILDSKPENEKSDCWQVYSIVTEEYQPNTERMRDWISIPKSNGYESLHTTVMGPHGKWVEVQIRTTRMDEVAEKGMAAHWKYKGGKGNADLDNWLAGIREILENPDSDPNALIDEFKTNIYDDELFVFTPKGDLKKLPAGSTVLDFAYDIHSGLGDKCVGGRINGRKVSIKQKLKNGDQVAIDTSNNQKPKLDWLDFVVTSKAKSRIKSSLNEARKREAENGKEIVKRKFKNWKIEYSDDNIRKLLAELKFKSAQDMYFAIASGQIEALALKNILKENTGDESKAKDVLGELLPKKVVEHLSFDNNDEFLVIDNNLKNINYKLAQCCNPIFGDDIFGFITIREGIKIHREACPNAAQMRERYPYRFIKARWKDNKQNNSFQATIHMVGTDRTGIVGDISYIIAKDVGVQMRSINIDSKNGEFEGVLRVFVNNIEHLDFLMHKLKNIKGIQHVSRGDF
ncbi:MAG: bifunctional (p)ppGpp synthetase/guanosine-3',5'-bis(diphosphate) 3'-pyrophosphohydrolase [Prolixibacteraceae bacterium]|nr:bifunctional (p)ppGpp synthetase/guanosine-3',5'-bis(diphosphate) 3'-pyrophosphohydrolase [Prolixibacteraceae bacterium]